MSAPDDPPEETNETPAGEESQPVKKRRVSINLAMAILAYHERKQFGYMVNVRDLAIRYNTTQGSLRDVYHQFLKGRIEMPIGPTPLEDLIDRRTLHEKLRGLGVRMTALIAHQLEGAMMLAEDLSGKGLKRNKRSDNPARNYKEINSDVRFLATSLAESIRLGQMIDEGYNSYLEDAQRRLHPPNPPNPIVPIGAAKQTAMLNAGETARALQALDTPMEVTPSAGE